MALTITCLLIVAVVLGAPENYWDRMQTISQYQEDTSAMIRLAAWKAGVQMALDNPVLGVGPGNFGSAHGLFYKVEDAYSERWNWVAAHSIYFGVLGELGFSGLLLLLSFLGSIFFANRRVRAHMTGQESDRFLLATSQALEVSIVGFMVCGIFLSVGGPFLYYTAALTVALQNIALKSTTRQEPDCLPSAVMRDPAGLRV